MTVAYKMINTKHIGIYIGMYSYTFITSKHHRHIMVQHSSLLTMQFYLHHIQPSQAYKGSAYYSTYHAVPKQIVSIIVLTAHIYISN
jgi:hypothetical protein